MTDSNKKLDVSGALAAAACVLLGNNSVAGLLDYDLGGDEWDARVAYMYYAESDDRVEALAPSFQLTRNVDTDEIQTFRVTTDTLTGASPTGAAAASGANQTFTGPSGSAYTVAAGKSTADSSFGDERIAYSAGWVRPLNDKHSMSLGANYSTENDYVSLGFSAGLSRYLNDKNTTLTAGFSRSNDTFTPIGGTPVPFDLMPDPGPRVIDLATADQDKVVTDLMFGVTQVIDKNTVVMVNLGLSNSDGYLNDPYRLISVVDANGDPVVANDVIDLSLALYGNRPDSRSRTSLYTQYKRNFNGSVLDTSYRFMTDDWDVTSHTLDFSYRMPIGSGGWLKPRLRFYTQTAANFHTPFFIDGEQPSVDSTGVYASSDYRLGEMDTTTVGMSYGRDGKRPWHVTLEYYLQDPKESAEKFGTLEDVTLSPDMTAVVLRFDLDI